MSANKVVLTHHTIEIQYSIGITPRLPASYRWRNPRRNELG
jgi:hypothetical protein